MMGIELMDADVAGRSVLRGVVTALAADGRVAVACDGEPGELLCDVLVTSDANPLELAAGDVVLVWHAARGGESPVVLGRVGRRRAAAPVPSPEEARAPEPADAGAIPDELVIEARHNLTLRCGEGSITIRHDGKILIKGKDLVSHAQRMNRIKGGAVAIN
jgi:hypothetical protein